MKVGVNLKIDVTKIDKTKLFQGSKGTYLDATVFIDIDNPDQYGNNGMITQALPKEEREAGEKGAILGNAKTFWKGEGQQPQKQPQGAAPAAPPNPDDGFDDIPFIDPYKFNWRVV